MMTEGLTVFQMLALVRHSFFLIPLALGPATPGRGTAASLSLERREPERESLAVELPEVEFAGAHRAPEDGTKASERSFSGANWL